MLKPTNLATKLTDSLWNYGEGGAILGGVIASMGVALNAFIGGWDVMVRALLLFMFIDYVTGFLCSMKNKTTNSETMFWGGINKVLVFILVGVGVMLDLLLRNEQPLIRTAIIWFYLARELLSIVENYGKMGNKLPPVLMETLQQITNKQVR